MNADTKNDSFLPTLKGSRRWEAAAALSRPRGAAARAGAAGPARFIASRRPRCGAGESSAHVFQAVVGCGCGSAAGRGPKRGCVPRRRPCPPRAGEGGGAGTGAEGRGSAGRGTGTPAPPYRPSQPHPWRVKGIHCQGGSTLTVSPLMEGQLLGSPTPTQHPHFF